MTSAMLSADAGTGRVPPACGAAAPRIAATFNGKFYSARPTGVHRVAGELIRAVDELMSGDEALRGRYDLAIACPRDLVREPAMKWMPWSIQGHLTGQFWEQLDLLRVRRRTLLVNLCNLGPVLVRRSVTMIHDAQVYMTPQSYSRGFRNYYRALLPMLGRRHARILTVSEYSRDQLVRYGVAPAGKISVIHNGADHMLRMVADRTAIERLALAEHGYVVALANAQAHKNIGVLLRAFALPALRDLQLVLVGGAGRQDFAAAGRPVPANVVFAGWVSDGELRGLLESALCVAVPSTTEGFGLPPLEGMILGCPAIVAPCGALPEVCVEAALYAAPDDPAEWAAAIVGLAADPGRRSALAAAARAHAGTLTWRRAAQALLAVIEAVSAEAA